MMLRTKLSIAAILSLAVPTAASAVVIVNVSQVGSDVVTEISGSLDLTGLTLVNSFLLDLAIGGAAGYVSSGTNANVVTGYSGLIGPSNFGTSDYITADGGTGSDFALNASQFGDPLVFVPDGYTSGAALGGTSTYLGKTLASLGLTTGQYVYRSDADSVTVNIGQTETPSVPEPSTWAMMIAGFAAVGFALRRRPRQAMLLQRA